MVLGLLSWWIMNLTGKLVIAAAVLGTAMGAYAQRIPAGTQLEIRTNEFIDGRAAGGGRIYQGEISQDVVDTEGRVAVRRGSKAELIVRKLDRNEVGLDLDGIVVDGKHYSVDASDITSTRKEGVGANGRTGKYVGGGAVLGTIIGAIAGGGKGAAIGGLAGAGAGAGTQMLTRGRNLSIPAETIVSFRLDKNLAIQDDRGYDKGGKHYHRDNKRQGSSAAGR